MQNFFFFILEIELNNFETKLSLTKKNVINDKQMERKQIRSDEENCLFSVWPHRASVVVPTVLFLLALEEIK